MGFSTITLKTKLTSFDDKQSSIIYWIFSSVVLSLWDQNEDCSDYYVRENSVKKKETQERISEEEDFMKEDKALGPMGSSCRIYRDRSILCRG